MASHGINFPCAMAGTVRPFPRHAGAAAGLFGFLSMAIAALVGAWIGASHDGTPVPLAAAVAGGRPRVARRPLYCGYART